MKTQVMNRNLIVSILAVMLLTYSIQGISYAQEAPDTLVEFADTNLAKAVRRALRLPTGDGVDLLKIPKAELEKLTGLEASVKEITDITGLEHATQLKTLYLSYNQIGDITPLAGLAQLATLELRRNQIRDITPLAQLTNLVELDLSSNSISDLTPLTQLTNLVELNLSGNNISDLTLLTQLLTQFTNLVRLGLSGNNISDLTPLAQLTNLVRLGLSNNNITDVTPLAQLRLLSSLDLSQNFITDVTPLAQLIGLGSLNLHLNRELSNIIPLAQLPLRTRILLSGGWVTPGEIEILAVSPLQPLTSITLDGGSATLTLLPDGAVYDTSIDNIKNALTVTGLDGVTVSDVSRVSDKELKVTLGFTGSLEETTILTFSLGKAAVPGYEGRDLTGTAHVYPQFGFTATTSTHPLEAVERNGIFVTLRLSGGAFENRTAIADALTISGLTDISYDRTFGLRRVSDSVVTLYLRFTGNLEMDSVLTFTIGVDGIKDYNGPALTAEIPFSTSTEVEITGEVVASTMFPLTTATLNGSIVKLTLKNLSFNDNDRDQEIITSGIPGVDAVSLERIPYIRVLNEQEALVKLSYEGNLTEDATLTFFVPYFLIRGNYDGPPLATTLPVTVKAKRQVHVPELENHLMYWINTDTDKIESVGPFDVVTQGVESLTVDTASGRLYWSERSSSGGIIKRANFDGTNVETLASLSSVPRGIAIDAVENKLYWTNSDLQIQTASLNGEDLSTVIQLEDEIVEETIENCSSGGSAVLLFLIIVDLPDRCSTETILVNLTTPTDIAVNTADGRLYWTELSGRIRRVSLNGTNAETLLSDLGKPYGITVADGKVYWAEEIDAEDIGETGSIRRANLNGTNIETLAKVYDGIPLDLSVDTAAGKVYWANSLGGIQRIDLDGGEVETVVSGVTTPADFVLVPGAQPTTPTTTTTDATVSVSPASVASPAVGDQLEFSLKITDGEAVAGYQATVQFDDTALRYVSGANGDFLPAGAFFAEPVVERNRVKLNAAPLAGEINGDGTLATLTFEVVSVKTSTLKLSDVLLSNSAGVTFVPQVENAEITESPQLTGDVNGDGTVNIADLVLVASNIGKTGQNAVDVNGDGQINIADLVLVAGALGTSAAAPSLHPHALEMLTATEVKQWLFQAQQLGLTDTTSQRGILFLQQLLAALTPKETVLLANYPNPFNPETWIPYHLATDADVTLHIYTVNGTLVRTLTLGHQAAGMYQNRSRAAYWDGKNEFGEKVASGLYFYTLTAGDFSATRKLLIRK